MDGETEGGWVGGKRVQGVDGAHLLHGRECRLRLGTRYSYIGSAALSLSHPVTGIELVGGFGEKLD